MAANSRPVVCTVAPNTAPAVQSGAADNIDATQVPGGPAHQLVHTYWLAGTHQHSSCSTMMEARQPLPGPTRRCRASGLVHLLFRVQGSCMQQGIERTRDETRDKLTQPTQPPPGARVESEPCAEGSAT